MTERDFQSSASHQGRAFEDHVERVLIANGYDIIERRWRHPDVDVEIDFIAAEPGHETVYWIECKGSWESNRPGLERTDTVKKLLGSAWMLNATPDRLTVEFIVITSDPPKDGSAGDLWLRYSLKENLIDAVWHLPLTFVKWNP